MFCFNLNKSLEKERKDVVEIGVSQFELVLVNNDRERRGGISREEEYLEGELYLVSVLL